jgi:quinol monooxygenase YgiN
MIIITGFIVVRPEQRAAALALGTRHSRRSRGEPGCIAHNVHVDAENDARLVFLEMWQDRSAVEAHFALPASRAFVRELAGMAADGRRIKVFEGIEVAELGHD